MRCARNTRFFCKARCARANFVLNELRAPPRVTRGVPVGVTCDGASTGHARIPGCGVTREYGSGVTRAYGSRAYVRGTPVRVTPVRVTVTQPLLLYRLIEYTVKSIIAQPEAERAGAQSRLGKPRTYSATGARAPCCSTCTNPPRAPPPPRLWPLPSSR